MDDTSAEQFKRINELAMQEIRVVMTKIMKDIRNNINLWRRIERVAKKIEHCTTLNCPKLETLQKFVVQMGELVDKIPA